MKGTIEAAPQARRISLLRPFFEKTWNIESSAAYFTEKMAFQLLIQSA